MLKDFYPFAKERFGFDRSVNIKYLSNPQNSADPLGKTAFYESENDTVNVYVDNRHPKDILRSISHELVHHTQNCRGQLSNISTAGEQGYAQNDLHLREMERQAYELGNMCFRDWEDQYKQTNYNNELNEWTNESFFDALKNYFSSRNRSLTKDQQLILELYQEKISIESFFELEKLNDFNLKSLEIGFGTGEKLLQSAISYPDNLFIGIEYYKKLIQS